MHRKLASVVLLLVLMLMQTACSSDQVITSLELAVNAVSAALPLIGPSAGLPADTQAQIQTYLGATSDAIAKASDILSGPGTDATKAAAIASAFAGIAAPVVPPKYQGVAQAVSNVSAMVARFLANLPSQNAVLRSSGAGNAFFESPSKKTTKVSEKERKRLAAIKAKAQAAAAAAKK